MLDKFSKKPNYLIMILFIKVTKRFDKNVKYVKYVSVWMYYTHQN